MTQGPIEYPMHSDYEIDRTEALIDAATVLLKDAIDRGEVFAGEGMDISEGEVFEDYQRLYEALRRFGVIIPALERRP